MAWWSRGQSEMRSGRKTREACLIPVPMSVGTLSRDQNQMLSAIEHAHACTHTHTLQRVHTNTVTDRCTHTPRFLSLQPRAALMLNTFKNLNRQLSLCLHFHFETEETPPLCLFCEDLLPDSLSTVLDRSSARPSVYRLCPKFLTPREEQSDPEISGESMSLSVSLFHSLSARFCPCASFHRSVPLRLDHVSKRAQEARGSYEREQCGRVQFCTCSVLAESVGLCPVHSLH